MFCVGAQQTTIYVEATISPNMALLSRFETAFHHHKAGLEETIKVLHINTNKEPRAYTRSGLRRDILHLHEF